MEQSLRQLDVPLDDLDEARLTPIVRQALDSQSATVADWRQEKVSSGIGLGTAVYRLTGRAQDDGQTIPWSLILKVQLPIPGQDDPTHWFYWKREVKAYRSGWLDKLPGGIAAPRCYGVEERPDGSCWLWLEEVKDDIGRKWPLEHYGIVARHLGQFNGAYLTGKPMPTYPWLSRDGIRRHVESSAAAIEQVRHSLDRPLVRRWLKGGVGKQLFQTWEERDQWLELLDRLPQTVCQYDAFRRNLFAHRLAGGGFKTIIIDWSYTGFGAIGTELMPLVVGTVAFFEADMTQMHELERLVLEGYIEGVRDAGWRGDPRLVELGYYLSGIRYGLGSVGEILPFMIEDPPPVNIQAVYGCTIEELLDYWNALWDAFAFEDRTRKLVEELGM